MIKFQKSGKGGAKGGNQKGGSGGGSGNKNSPGNAKGGKKGTYFHDDLDDFATNSLRKFLLFLGGKKWYQWLWKIFSNWTVKSWNASFEKKKLILNVTVIGE